MSSLRKKVSSYFRQLSFHNEPRKTPHFLNENTFVNRYLTGEINLKDAPPVLYGKSPNDLPNFEIGDYDRGPGGIVGCATGPNGGLTTVKRIEKHLSIPDADIDYIDKQEDAAENGPNKTHEPTPMKIKVAGQTYIVSKHLEKEQKRKSLSLGSLTDEQPVEMCNTNTNVNNNNYENITDTCLKNKNVKTVENIVDEVVDVNYALSKSKSAGCSLDKNNKKGKILRLTQRPGSAQQSTQQAQKGAYQNPTNPGGSCINVPEKWDKKTDHVYGISDSLYDTNQTTKEKNGNPIADCFGVIAREDSAVLALADGVNWGEKACIAAKSAVHGSLHYINKTVFDDASLFNFDIDSLDENAPINTNFVNTARNGGGDCITNTNEIFICLLRAFNSAHNLILENNGMLTTLTVAVVLPLKQGNFRKGRAEKYICCVCNLGDTFAYVYSPKCGIREITKGSHDITSNRDMRDALGALGPVDGINPELNNLTLSATTLEPGDIVLIASDGLSDNYDPSVCKFTVNQTTYDAPKHKITNISQKMNRPPVSKPNSNRNSLIQAQNQPHVSNNKASNISRLASTNINASTTTTTIKSNKNTKPPQKDSKNPPQDEVDFANPLVAQFLQDNAIAVQTEPKSTPPVDKKPYRRVVSMVDPPTSNKENKSNKSNALSKSSSTSRVLKTKTNANQLGFLRSKTSVDLKPVAQVKRNEEGVPFVAPLQKYELTLLLMEDILLRGLSGRELPCVTAKTLCENLLRYTVSITAAKRRSLEDKDLYYDVREGVRVEVSAREKKLRRKRCLEKIQNLPGKLDHVTVVACNVGNRLCGDI